MSKARPGGDLGLRLDAALVTAAASSVPGAQATVVQDGEVVWSGCHGVADLASGAPVSEHTVFSLASLGKTLVATLALRLVEAGRLDLEAPISQVLADDVPGADVVTAQMLLSHTSGYPDLYDTREVAALMPPDEDEPGSGSEYDPDRPFTWAMLVPGIRDPVAPGAGWEYSNAGYIVLTEMLVRILGGPGGLTSTWGEIATALDPCLTDDLLTMDRSTVSTMARGCTRRADGSFVDRYAAHRPSGIPADLFGLPFGDGLFAGTAIGVARFLDGLFVRGAVLEPATLDLMTATTPQAAAAEVPEPALATYGLGTCRIRAGGGGWQGHRGTYGGFTTVGASERSLGTTLVVLTNGSGPEHGAGAIWHALADELGGSLRAAAAAGSARTR